MQFPGTWMTESGSMAYRVVPKCACSTIGQIMFYSDHGAFYDGDIHDATEGLLKWPIEAHRPAIQTAIAAHSTYVFTCVRNPYTRILSAFFDKIAGIQRSGKRYRGLMVPQVMQRYGVDVGSPDNSFDFDQIRSFRRFLLFARDTIRFKRPMEPDIHWMAATEFVTTVIHNGGCYDAIFNTEHFNQGMGNVLDRVKTPTPVNVADMPRFNESAVHGPKQLHPVSAYFDDLSRHLMWEIYHRDFKLFRYDFDAPDNKMPTGPLDLEEIHDRLAW
ncbi:MAG TPA: sulfotransferase family protein [Paenirhodobacter sp.]